MTSVLGSDMESRLLHLPLVCQDVELKMNATTQFPPAVINPLLVAQAMIEGITLLTPDAQLAEYPGPVRKV